mgnify:FL=1
MGIYFDELKRAMTWLGEQQETIFVGQAVKFPGTFMHGTLNGVPVEKRLEMPVAESFQLQFCIGLALMGFVPISIYPRQNFLLLSASDLVNLLDKLPVMSSDQVKPKVIIRTASGPTKPLFPGHQHVGNYADAFRQMLTWVKIVELNSAKEILSTYQQAYERDGATLVIEHGDLL